MQFKKLFIPNAHVDQKTFATMVVMEVLITIVMWFNLGSVFLPKPREVVTAFVDLWYQGLAENLITSFTLNCEAICMATAISLVISWLGVVPVFKPIVAVIGKMRYVSMAGLLFAFTLATSNGHQLKLTVLVWSVTVFFVVSMVDVLDNVPKEMLDLARVLHMSPWKVVWEVQVLGTVDKALDVMRQNVAMAWLTLAFAEAISRNEGGVGTMLANSAKYFHVAEIMALQIVIFSLGLFQDYFIGWMKKQVCPYAFLTVEAK